MDGRHAAGNRRPDAPRSPLEVCRAPEGGPLHHDHAALVPPIHLIGGSPSRLARRLTGWQTRARPAEVAAVLHEAAELDVVPRRRCHGAPFVSLRILDEVQDVLADDLAGKQVVRMTPRSSLVPHGELPHGADAAPFELLPVSGREDGVPMLAAGRQRKEGAPVELSLERRCAREDEERWGEVHEAAWRTGGAPAARGPTRGNTEGDRGAPVLQGLGHLAAHGQGGDAVRGPTRASGGTSLRRTSSRVLVQRAESVAGRSTAVRALRKGTSR